MNTWAAIAALWMLSGAAQADCSRASAPTLYEYRSTPPLLAAETDASLVVTMHADGCVSAHFPAQDLRRGDYRLQLDDRGFKRAAGELEAARIDRYSEAAMRDRLRKASGRELYRVSDENIVEFRLASVSKSGKPETVRVTTLRDHLLQLPDDPALIGLAAADDLFRELAERTLTQGRKVQP